MTVRCCDQPENRGFYRANDPPGWAAYCKKCGLARLATDDEVKEVENSTEDLT
jgi:hypothetical protein